MRDKEELYPEIGKCGKEGEEAVGDLIGRDGAICVLVDQISADLECSEHLLL